MLCGLNYLIHVQCLEQCLTHSISGIVLAIIIFKFLQGRIYVRFSFVSPKVFKLSNKYSIIVKNSEKQPTIK